MKKDRNFFPSIIVLCTLLSCTVPLYKTDHTPSLPENSDRELSTAYRSGDFGKVMEAAGRAVLANNKRTVSLFYYTSLVCFAEGKTDQGMQWFFMALDNTRAAGKEDILSPEIIPEYEKLKKPDNRGVLTALWFLYNTVKNENESEKVFPGTRVELVDQAMAAGGFEITIPVYLDALLFCAKHKDLNRFQRLIDSFLFKWIENIASFKVLENIMKWPAVMALDKGAYIKGVISEKMKLFSGRQKIAGGIKAAKEDIFSAIGFFQEAVGIFMEIECGSGKWIAKGLNELGIVYRNIGEYSKAKDCFSTLLTITRDYLPADRHPWHTGTLMVLGILTESEGEYKKAETFYSKAMEISKNYLPEKKNRDFATLVSRLGTIYLKLADYRRAESYLHKAGEIQKNYFPIEKHPDYISTLDGLAQLYTLTWDYDKAESLYVQILKIRKMLRPAGRHPDYAFALNHLGDLYVSMGDYEKAESLILQSLEITKKFPPSSRHPEYAGTLNSLALAYMSMSDYKQAESKFLMAMDILTPLPPAGKNPDYLSVMTNLAALYRLMGDYSRAESFLLQVIESEKIYKENDRGLFYLKVINNLAGLYKDMRDYSKANHFYTQAAEILMKFSPEGKKKLYTTLMNNFALLFELQGNYKEAEKYYLYALEMYKSFTPQRGSPGYASTLSNLGILYNKISEYDKAESVLMEACAIKEKLAPEGKNLEYADVLNNLGILYETMGDYNRAAPLLTRSLSIYREFLQSNLMILSENEKNSFLNTLFPLFERFYSFSEKHLWQNSGLGRTIVDLRLFQKAILFRSSKKIRERIRRSGDNKLNKKFTKWLNIRHKINKARELTEEERSKKAIDLKKWEEEANKLEKDLSVSSEEFRFISKQAELSFKDVRAALKPGEAAVELIRYRFYDQKWTDVIHYAALIIKFDSEYPKLVFLENGHLLENEIISLYGNFISETANNPAVCRDSATFDILYKHLWKKIAENLNSEEKIYFSPDGIYHFVNPGTLKDTRGRWLAERWEFIRITSLNDLPGTKNDKSLPINPPLLVGFPDYNLNGTKREQQVNNDSPGLSGREYGSISYTADTPYPPLPGTKKEVENIAALFNEQGIQPETWLWERALEENLKRAESPGVLHLATHAFFLEDITPRQDFRLMGVNSDLMAEDPLLRSGLLLTGAAAALKGKTTPDGLENGILTSREAMDLNLYNTGLVVLSACNTALGVIKNGEGVYGLQRAFLTAGADAVLMSLWLVADEAASEFMTEFYRRWLSGETLRDAYNEATMWMKIKYPSPFYWGCFILIEEKRS